jgi:hypothetical protein
MGKRPQPALDPMRSLAIDTVQNMFFSTLTANRKKEVMNSFVQVLPTRWPGLPYDKGEDDAKFCH